LKRKAGQTSKFRIRVGLPLNENDGGTGGVQGAWNGNIQTLGNGGFAGSVTGVTSAINTGCVGTGTDTGHNAAISNPITNPNPPPATVEVPSSESGAAFGLNPDGTINYGRIMDYGRRGQHHANMWGRRIAKIYYGQKHRRNYYTGCSDGGREGHEMAQRFGQDFDGIVALSPAIPWDRWGFSGGWGNYVTPAEAAVVNKIWDGPRNPDGSKMWVGRERGTQGVFGITPPTTGTPTLFGEQINRYWVHRDPVFNWRSISEEQFLVEQRNLTEQFEGSVFRKVRCIAAVSNSYGERSAGGLRPRARQPEAGLEPATAQDQPPKLQPKKKRTTSPLWRVSRGATRTKPPSR
jgi:hypothetical protein